MQRGSCEMSGTTPVGVEQIPEPDRPRVGTGQGAEEDARGEVAFGEAFRTWARVGLLSPRAGAVLRATSVLEQSGAEHSIRCVELQAEHRGGQRRDVLERQERGHGPGWNPGPAPMNPVFISGWSGW
jgi:hypothetical protein